MSQILQSLRSLRMTEGEELFQNDTKLRAYNDR